MVDCFYVTQIYVIDSSQGEVTVEEQCRLEQCLGATELRGLPLLVLCNKQDMPNALSAAKVPSTCFILLHYYT